jgi:REP element-mobilizing transposase RayT
MGETSTRFGWEIHAFALLRNHFHLALTTAVPNLCDGMHWLQTTFAIRFNRFRSERGHLFQGRYQSPLVENATALVRAVDYIHLNPVRAGIVCADQVADFRWSSLARFVKGPRPEWLSAKRWLQELGLEDTATRLDTLRWGAGRFGPRSRGATKTRL